MDKKIRVLHILSRLDTGGLENGVVNLCNNLDRSRFTAGICCLKGLGPMAFRLSADVATYNLNFSEGKDFMRPFKVAAFLRKNKFDIVHTHAWGQGSFEGILGAYLAGVPVIINGEHGDFFNKYYQIILQRILAKLCKVTLSVSESLKQQVHTVLGIPLDAISVIINGVDTKKFSGTHDVGTLVQELKNDYGFFIQPDDFVIACIGSLKTQKNQELLIRTLALFKSQHRSLSSRVKVLFVGVGSDQQRLMQLTKDLSVDPQVVFMGNRNDTEVILSLAQVLVSCSQGNKEGLSNVILEAMASGKAVIAVRNVGMDEIIGFGVNGFLLVDGNEQELLKFLRLLIDQNGIMKGIESVNRNKAVTKFSLQMMVDRYQSLYFSFMKI